eukprot:708425-Pyramimonas_sp.AAC.1
MSPPTVTSLPPSLSEYDCDETMRRPEQVPIPPDEEMGADTPPGGEDEPDPTLEGGTKTPDDDVVGATRSPVPMGVGADALGWPHA